MYFHIIGDSGFLFDTIYIPKFAVRCYLCYLISCSFHFSQNRVFPRPLDLVDTLLFFFKYLCPLEINRVKLTTCRNGKATLVC